MSVVHTCDAAKCTVAVDADEHGDSWVEVTVATEAYSMRVHACSAECLVEVLYGVYSTSKENVEAAKPAKGRTS